eukprot:CAMPEP_0113595250 /NCGR_PEP_ID=MMETSP0015_2-20120614/39559_1 /TAXON_ID=2838 /ORGANISM="Odontella" /LENGTH=45 /DNA_ID=CAMNT_0000502399 /DNA_START=22 /DNA_END=155 /DNA_ORIENTATION=- /assembly_acc=CAM_ASM_000160
MSSRSLRPRGRSVEGTARAPLPHPHHVVEVPPPAGAVGRGDGSGV